MMKKSLLLLSSLLLLLVESRINYGILWDGVHDSSLKQLNGIHFDMKNYTEDGQILPY